MPLLEMCLIVWIWRNEIEAKDVYCDCEIPCTTILYSVTIMGASATTTSYYFNLNDIANLISKWSDKWNQMTQHYRNDMCVCVCVCVPHWGYANPLSTLFRSSVESLIIKKSQWILPIESFEMCQMFSFHKMCFMCLFIIRDLEWFQIFKSVLNVCNL